MYVCIASCIACEYMKHRQYSWRHEGLYWQWQYSWRHEGLYFKYPK
jgi:hypothetical protein